MLWFILSALQKGDKYGEFPTPQMIKDRKRRITFHDILNIFIFKKSKQCKILSQDELENLFFSWKKLGFACMFWLGK